MGELIKLFIEWAKKEKHWPLILLVAIIPAFWFCQLFFELKFRDTLVLPSFLIGSGVICAVSGILDWAIMWRGWRRLWLSVPPVAVGCALVVAGIMRINPIDDSPPPPLPYDKLVVTIANFTSDNVNVARLLRDALLDKQSGAPLKVNPIGKEVTGDNDEERTEAAKLLGRSRESNAHVVLWGEVIEVIAGDKRKFKVPGGLAVANEWQEADVQGALARVSFDIPFRFCSNSTEEIADSLAEIVTIVLGVAHYRVQKWDDAASILETVRSGEGQLYKGLCYYQKAHQPSNTREEDLLAAIGIYQALLVRIDGDDRTISYNLSCGQDNPSRQHQKNKLRGMAHFMLADAELSLGKLLSGQQALRHLQNAAKNYGIALKAEREMQNRWAVENNLGVALFELARMSGENDMDRYAKEAVDTYRFAVNDCPSKEDPMNCALVHNNFGSTLAYLSARTDGEQKDILLSEAERELWSALDTYNREKQRRGDPDDRIEFSKQWAMVQTNYASVLLERAKQTPGGQGRNGYLSKAVEEYRGVLEVYDRESEPQKHATVQNNLGTALYDLAKHNHGEGAKAYLQDALAAFRAAVDIRDTTGPPLSLANSRQGLAKTLTEMSTGEPAEKYRYLTEAIRLFDDVLSFYSRARYPQKHQEILAEKAHAVSLRH